MKLSVQSTGLLAAAILFSHAFVLVDGTAAAQTTGTGTPLGGGGPAAGGGPPGGTADGPDDLAQGGSATRDRGLLTPDIAQPPILTTAVPSIPAAPAGPQGGSTFTYQALFPVGNGFKIQPDGTRVMCMGDSITSGFGGVGGYRYALWSLMLGAGFAPDFVGSSTVASPFFMPDPEHEGHSGWRMADFADHLGVDGKPTTSIESFLVIFRPSIVLLHAGTNDLWSKDDWQRAPDDLDHLLDRIHAHNPRILTVVAKILPTVVEPVNLSVAWMNREFHDVVYSKWQSGHNVQLVDMQAACPVLTTVDGVHPDQVCYTLMAIAFLEGILLADERVMAPVVDPPLIGGLSAVASSEDIGYLADVAVNGTGIDGTLHQDDEGAPNCWRSLPFNQVAVSPGVLGPSGPPETLTIQLGAAHDVQMIELWNGRSAPISGGADWLALESIRKLGVETSLDGTVWIDRGELLLTEGPPRDRTPPEALAVNWPDTAHVRLSVLETYAKLPGQLTSIDAAVALSEVRLRGVPKP